MQPLVLAIEPDLRQAAIVKRIVREKVLADVTVVDTRDAALEAMRTSVPDVLLLSALLSPRDEDELFAHLRTLEHAEHLQTHTIPQLASAIAPGESKPSKGLLSSLWRRKESGRAPAGCDPDLFADEIRTYLQRASEKKRELRDAPVAGPLAAAAMPPRPGTPAVEARAAQPAAAGAPSSWESPFEWRPSGSTKPPAPAPVQTPAPETAEAIQSLDSFDLPADLPEPPSESFVFPTAPLEPSVDIFASVEAAPETAVESLASLAVVSEPPVDIFAAVVPEPPVDIFATAVVIPEPASQPSVSPVLSFEQPVPAIESRPRGPLLVRQPSEWWFEEPGPRAASRESEIDSELRAVLGALAIPAQVAAIGYAEGCRIRRVRLSDNA
jgi:hypothetical protein